MQDNQNAAFPGHPFKVSGADMHDLCGENQTCALPDEIMLSCQRCSVVSLATTALLILSSASPDVSRLSCTVTCTCSCQHKQNLLCERLVLLLPVFTITGSNNTCMLFINTRSNPTLLFQDLMQNATRENQKGV